jgi:hypothetical protein
VSWWVYLCLWLWVFENVCEKCELELHVSVWEFVWIVTECVRLFVIWIVYVGMNTMVCVCVCVIWVGGGVSERAWRALVPTYAC